MHYSKKRVASMPKAYAIGTFDGDDAKSFLVGVEKEGPIQRFALDGTFMETVTEGPGGVMTITQVPGRGDQVLATSEFFSPNYGADTAGIVCYTRMATGAWAEHRICDLPYVHRFGVLKGAHGDLWLIACTIKGGSHHIKEDWRSPGAVYVAKLGEHLENESVKLTELSSCQLQNHGFWMSEDKSYALISTAAGVFRYTPPTSEDGQWEVACLLVQPTSDICVADFDGDGINEILTLSPFHGNTLAVWHQSGTEDCYTKVWEDPIKRDFLHAIWSGTMFGKPCAVIGNRKANAQAGRDLLRVFYAEGIYQLETIDTDCGPANCCLIADGDDLRIVAAHRETDEVALYTTTRQ